MPLDVMFALWLWGTASMASTCPTIAPTVGGVTSMTFDEAFDLTMTWEGGGRTHRVTGDPGGTTKWGISQRAYPTHDIPLLTERKAKMLARLHYWNPLHADDLPAALRWQVFDTGFNAGVTRSAVLLQRSVNLCRQAQGVESFIDEDGRIGPATLDAVDRIDPDRLALTFKAHRIGHYMALADRSPRFIYGWLRRAEGGRGG